MNNHNNSRPDRDCIRHRHVFYLSGFDPRGASFYHRTFSNGAAKQAVLNGIQSTVSPRKKLSDISQGWKIEANDQGEAVETQYEFLRWDDIIRQNWVKSFFSIFIDFVYVAWVFITTGTLKRVAKASRTPAITGLYPAVFIAVSGLLGVLLWFATVQFFTVLDLTALGYLFGAVLFALLIYAAKVWGDRINVFWLLRIYAFTSRWASGKMPVLDQRVDAFADRIVEAFYNKPCDEIILVGHSVGSMLSTAVAARVIKRLSLDGLDERQVIPRLNMITLGECIPLLSLLPRASKIRDDLSTLSHSKRFFWVDYTSPADGACFPLVDPIKVSLREKQSMNSPVLLSARFHRLFKTDRYQQLRRNFYELHFLYLMSNDYLGQYDFFAMMIGKQALIERITQQYSELNLTPERGR